jgi:hypothetical protein
LKAVVVWAILALIGVPLWLCAAGILVLLHNNRRLRTRPGNIPVRVLPAGKTRWRRGHGIWVSDVFAWRSSPAGWSEELSKVLGGSCRAASHEERKRLHGIGDAPAVASLRLASGEELTVAARSEDAEALLGPHAPDLNHGDLARGATPGTAG